MTAIDDFDAPPPEGGSGDATDRLKLELNDTGNGERLAIGLAGQALYVEGVGWLVWDGARFSPVAGNERMRKLATKALARMLEEEEAAESRQPLAQEQIAHWMAEHGEYDQATAERKLRAERKRKRRAFALQCGNMSKVKAAMEAAASDFLVPLESLDTDRSVVQLPNGTLNLAEIGAWQEAEDEDERRERWRRALLKHDRASRPTRVGGCAFDPDATAEEWARFLSIIMPDPEMQRYLQALCGSLLAGQEGERAGFFLGKGGNGKSTVVKAIKHILGDYAQTCRIEMFCEQRNIGNGPTPEEAVLPGARVYMASEPDTTVTISASKLKGLTGGEERQANPKHKAVFSYTPVGVPLIQANKMPRVKDPSVGFWRRVYPVLFEARLDELPPAERRSSSQMYQTIRREAPGILNWLLEGWAIYSAEGIQVPRRAAQLKESLQALADPVGEFIAEQTERRTGARVKTSELHKAFVAWSEAQNEKAMTASDFKSQMLALDFVRHKSCDWYWLGLELLNETASAGERSPYADEFR